MAKVGKYVVREEKIVCKKKVKTGCALAPFDRERVGLVCKGVEDVQNSATDVAIAAMT